MDIKENIDSAVRIKAKLEHEDGNKNIINYIEKVYKNNK